MTELSPRDTLERLFHRWPVVAVCIILGGMFGWLGSTLLRPIYQASATIKLHLDSALWGQEQVLSKSPEVQLFTSYQPISDLLFSAAVIQDFSTAAEKEDLPINQDNYLSVLSIQRMNLTWLLTARSTDPVGAARMANIWVESALPIYRQAHEAAIAAQALELERLAIVKCFSEASLPEGNACAGTSFSSLADLDPALAGLDSRITAARTSSRSLDPALTIEVGDPAVAPVNPIRYPRTWLMLAGTLVGLIAGIILAQGRSSLQKKK